MVRFTLRLHYPGVHCVGRCVGTGAGLEIRRTASCTAGSSKQGTAG